MRLPVPYSNPLAPIWMTPQYNICQRHQRYDVTVTVAANTTSNNNQIQFDNDSDFLWTGIAFDQGVISGIRFRDWQGRLMNQEFLDPRDVQGPLPIIQVMPCQSKLFVDLQNTTDDPITVQVILQGMKQYEGTTGPLDPRLESLEFVPLWQRYSSPCDGWHDEPFDYYFQVSLAANGIANHQILLMDQDADFYWRGSSWNGNDSAGRLRWKFTDNWRNDLSPSTVPSANLFGNLTAAKPLYPEVICPSGGYLQYDVLEYTGLGSVTADIRLTGIKRFKN